MPQRFQQFYDPEEVAELQRLHRLICKSRGIDPASEDGHELAGALMVAFDAGDRDESSLMARFSPPQAHAAT